MKLFPATDNTTRLQWFCIKLSLVFYWLANLLIMLYQAAPHMVLPVGIYRFINPQGLFTPAGRLALGIAALALALLYLREKHMAWVTFFQFLLSVLIISYHESGGIYNHATVFSVLFAAQCIAYVQGRFNPLLKVEEWRVQYSLQVIVAMYVLAALTKLLQSGIGWINSGELFALQVVKNYSFISYARADSGALQQGYRLAYELLAHKYLIRLFLAGALLLEAACFAVLVWPRLRPAYGVALLGMHAGIKIIMAIPFGVVAPPMAILFINPLYWLVQYFPRAFNLIKQH